MFKRVVVTLLLLLALAIIGCLESPDQSAATPLTPTPEPIPAVESVSATLPALTGPGTPDYS
jgi:hypothetical protein